MTVKRKRTSIYIREDLIEKAKQDAAKQHRTYNNYIEYLIDKAHQEATGNTITNNE